MELGSSFRQSNGRYVGSVALTRNGSTSLITTIPNEIWNHAGIDHDDPGSVYAEYDPETKQLTLRL